MSATYLTSLTDKRVDQQMIAHAHECKSCDVRLAHGNVSCCSNASIEKDAMNLYYLKPMQKALICNEKIKRFILRGPAGSGKTIVILSTILQLSREDTHLVIILVAPYPHHLRCQQFLQSNGIDVRMGKMFPQSGFPLDSKKCVVWIFSLENFLHSLPITATPISNIHIFIDDFQNVFDYLKTKKVSRMATEFLKDFNKQSEVADKHMIIAVDECQRNDDLCKSLLEVEGLPAYHLREVVRNSQPIVEVVMQEFSVKSESLDTSQRYCLSMGHMINGPAVELHILKHPEGVEINREKQKSHLQLTIEKVLQVHNSLAILADDNVNDLSVNDCRSVCQNLNLCVSSIEEFILREHTVTDMIVIDDVKNAPSFEMPVIVSIAGNTSIGADYIMVSRARSQLICVVYASPKEIEELRKDYPNVKLFITHVNDIVLENSRKSL